MKIKTMMVCSLLVYLIALVIISMPQPGLSQNKPIDEKTINSHSVNNNLDLKKSKEKTLTKTVVKNNTTVQQTSNTAAQPKLNKTWLIVIFLIMSAFVLFIVYLF